MMKSSLPLGLPALRLPRLRAAWTRFADVLTPVLAVAGLLLALEWAIVRSGVAAYLLPPPSMVLHALGAMAADGSLWANVQVTLYETLAGFCIALAAGVVIGSVIASSRVVELTVYGYLVALQTLPKIALAPLFVAWFGFGPASKIAVAALIAFFPILVSVITGLKNCDPGKLDLMRTLSASPWQTLRYVRMPAALPYIFAGADVAIVFALTGAIVGEFVGAHSGLGYQMVVANSQLETSKVYAILVVLCCAGIALHGAVALLRRRCLAWMPQESVATSPSP